MINKERAVQQKEGVIRDNEELIQTLLVRMLVSDAEQIAAGCWVDVVGQLGHCLRGVTVSSGYVYMHPLNK